MGKFCKETVGVGITVAPTTPGDPGTGKDAADLNPEARQNNLDLCTKPLDRMDQSFKCKEGRWWRTNYETRFSL